MGRLLHHIFFRMGFIWPAARGVEDNFVAPYLAYRNCQVRPSEATRSNADLRRNLKGILSLLASLPDMIQTCLKVV